MPIVFSTHYAGTRYVRYTPVMKDSKGNPVQGFRNIERELNIRGGAGIYNEDTKSTPTIVETVVTDEELQFLKSLEAFNDDIEKGFIVVSEKEKLSHEKISKEMNRDSKSLPKTPEKLNLKKNGNGANVTYDMPSVEEIEEKNRKSKYNE